MFHTQYAETCIEEHITSAAIYLTSKQKRFEKLNNVETTTGTFFLTVIFNKSNICKRMAILTIKYLKLSEILYAKGF